MYASLELRNMLEYIKVNVFHKRTGKVTNAQKVSKGKKCKMQMNTRNKCKNETKNAY